MKTELDKRLELNSIFTDMLGTTEKKGSETRVYFQPPASVNMKYPAIRYERAKPSIKFANNKLYMSKQSYQVILIDEDPDSEYYSKILELPLCSFDRSYVANNLNHYVFTLYY